MLQKRSAFPLTIVLAAGLALSACSEEDTPPSGDGSATVGTSARSEIRISPSEASAIGKQIWINECSGTVEGLTSWNKGEYFASLGIGHFIWYHGRRGPFDESFPPLIKFMESRGVAVPAVARQKVCPWTSREQFLAAKNSPEMRELRTFLHKTIPYQTEFILKRLEAALPKMLASVPASERATVKGRFYAVAATQKGKYALMDYVNFKGEGTKASERYKGQGWGMLQVLQEMRAKPLGNAAVVEYAAAADRVLTRRVANAPKDESRWLPGWRNRLKTYRP